MPGVAEVASIGGFQKQYQVNIDPTKLLAFNIPISTVVQAIRDGNNDVGGRLVEFTGAEYMVRGRGYAKSVQDIEKIVVGADKQGTPILVKNLGFVTLGPEIRRGVADLDGEGDTVGGIVIMRAGENALNVIERVKEKLRGNQAVAAQGSRDRHDLRPLDADRTLHRHAEGRVAPGSHHRQPGHLDIPLAYSVGDHSHSDDSGFGRAGVHPAFTSWG